MKTLQTIKNLVPVSVKRHVPFFIKRALNNYAWKRMLLPDKADADIEQQQLASIVRLEKTGPPPPPKQLQIRALGCYVPDFIDSGYKAYDEIHAALRDAGMDMQSQTHILDFGCGCGRIIRAFRNRLPSHALYATDIDGEAIAWLQSNYSGIAEFSINPFLPPTKYADDSFDFIYSISIFTHLPEEMQAAWLAELHRIAKPGAYLYITTHGENIWRRFGGQKLRQMKETGFACVNYGKTIGLPDFYATAAHSENYIRREWSRWFDVVRFVPQGFFNYQDVTILKNR